MRYLKKFNEGIGGNTGQDDKIVEFTNRFNWIMNGEYEQGYEPSNTDLLSEIGDLCNELDMSSDDIKKVIDSGVSDVNGLLKIIYDETLQDEVENGAGYTGYKDGSDRKQEVYDAITEMVKLERHGKDNKDNLSAWLEDLSDDSFEILYNLLAGSGKIQSDY